VRIVHIIAAAWLMLPCALVPALADKRVALVVGNGAYIHADRLTNPVNDARGIRDALKSPALKFDVIYGEDLDGKALRRLIGRFAGQVDGADVALAYFAGHGATFGDAPYLVPIDAEFTRLDEMPAELVAVEELIGELRRAKSVRIAILDACRDNVAEQLLKQSRGGASSRGLAPPKNPAGLIVAYATQHGATAADSAGSSNSPFTAALLHNIATPGLDVKEMFFRVGSEVEAATSGRQRPEISVSMYEQFALAPLAGGSSGNAVVMVPPAPVDPCAAAGDHWKSAEAIGTVDAFQDHLMRFPNCTFAGLARVRIEGLKSKAPADVPPVAMTMPPVSPPPVPAVTDLKPAPPAPRPGAAGGEQRHGGLPAGAKLVPRLERSSLYSIDFSPQGDRIVGWDGVGDKVIMWDIVKGKLLWSADDQNAGVGSVAFSPDGTRVASGGQGEVIRIRDAATGAIVRTVAPNDSLISEVAFLPNGWLAAADNDERVEIWNTTTGKLIRNLGGRSGCSSNCYHNIGVSPNGAQILSGYSDKSIKIWEVATGRVIRSFKVKSAAYDTAFSPDGTKFVSGHDDKTVKVWETATGRMLSSFVAHSTDIGSVAFSPDGARIASAGHSPDYSTDNLVKVWDTSGRLLKTLEGHQKDVVSIRFSPQGSHIASGSSDGTIKLWDVETGALLATFAGSGGHGVAYTPDGFFVTDIEPGGAAINIVQDGKELDSNEFAALNRRDSLADAFKATTARK
jgi:WD40 repeat protein